MHTTNEDNVTMSTEEPYHTSKHNNNNQSNAH